MLLNLFPPFINLRHSKTELRFSKLITLLSKSKFRIFNFLAHILSVIRYAQTAKKSTSAKAS